MSTPKGAAEAEIRAAVVARLRELMPAARIVHELNVAGQGSNRIDVAAITTQAIVAVEIKSSRDTLSRLGEQWEAFSKCCHLVLVAADRKHFIPHGNEHRRADLPPKMALNHELFIASRRHYGHQGRVWEFPRPASGEYSWEKPWTFDPHRDVRRQPHARCMLNMLWGEELRAESSRHKLPSSTRIARPALIDSMVWNLTGREICESVCRALRWRAFVNADAPIDDLRKDTA